MLTASPSSATSAPSENSASAADVGQQNGLTSDEVRGRLDKFGPNAMPDTSAHPLRRALEKFWAPVPWMLEAAIVLELALGKYVEAAIIAALLVFNAALGLFQQSRAQATLAALKSRLALNASVRRDGVWKIVPAVELVPGDVVKLSLGAVVAADVRLTGGEVLLDQSMLTGESVPIEAGAGVQTYAGALVRRGEAVAEITATGAFMSFNAFAASYMDLKAPIPARISTAIEVSRIGRIDCNAILSVRRRRLAKSRGPMLLQVVEQNPAVVVLPVVEKRGR